MLKVNLHLEFPHYSGAIPAEEAVQKMLSRLGRGQYPLSAVTYSARYKKQSVEHLIKTTVLELDEPLVLQKQVADIPTIIEDDLYEEATMQKILDVLRNKNTNPKQVKAVHKLIAVLVHALETDNPSTNIDDVEDDFIKAFIPHEEEKG